jgi:hypothetical protein
MRVSRLLMCVKCETFTSGNPRKAVFLDALGVLASLVGREKSTH